MRTTRGWVARSVCLSATGGGVLGGFISVIVNNALIEISLTPFFSAIFGLVLLLLGALCPHFAKNTRLEGLDIRCSATP